MLSLKLAAFGAMALVLAGTSVSLAQPQRPQQGKDDRFQPKQNTTKGNTQPVAKATIDDIARMLKSAGYQVNANKLDNGHVILELDISVKGKVVPVDIELSKDGSKIYLTSWFKQLGQGETIPANVMAKLLESNAVFGPMHFALSGSKQLYLAGPMDNRNVSVEDLRREIDIFVQVYLQTETLWNPSNW